MVLVVASVAEAASAAGRIGQAAQAGNLKRAELEGGPPAVRILPIPLFNLLLQIGRCRTTSNLIATLPVLEG